MIETKYLYFSTSHSFPMVDRVSRIILISLDIKMHLNNSQSSFGPSNHVVRCSLPSAFGVSIEQCCLTYQICEKFNIPSLSFLRIRDRNRLQTVWIPSSTLV